MNLMRRCKITSMVIRLRHLKGTIGIDGVVIGILDTILNNINQSMTKTPIIITLTKHGITKTDGASKIQVAWSHQNMTQMHISLAHIMTMILNNPTTGTEWNEDHIKITINLLKMSKVIKRRRRKKRKKKKARKRKRKMEKKRKKMVQQIKKTSLNQNKKKEKDQKVKVPWCKWNLKANQRKALLLALLI